MSPRPGKPFAVSPPVRGGRRPTPWSLALFPWSGLLYAAPADHPGPGLAGAQVLQMLIGLAVVLLLIGGLAWVLRNVLRVQPGVHGQMRVLGGLSLGARERVVLVEVGATQLVLGVSPGRVQTLHVLEEPLREPPEREETGFARQLAGALRRQA